jgi:hypothetical protein
VILLSSPRPEAVALLLVLPRESRLIARFVDDESARDITDLAADLLLEYLLRRDSGNSTETDLVEIADIELVGGDIAQARLAMIDTMNGEIGEVPPERVLPLLGEAIAMAVTDAVDNTELNVPTDLQQQQ